MAIEKEENEYRAYFTLNGDFDPAEITAKLRLKPSRSFRSGDPHPRTGLPRKESRWSLDSRLDRQIDIEQQAMELVDQLSPASNELELSSTYDGWITLVAYFLDGQASISLSADLVRLISALGLGIDVDPYDLLSSDKEDEKCL